MHGAVSPENQATSWSVEYGPTEEYGAVTTPQSLPGDSALHQVSTALPGLAGGPALPLPGRGGQRDRQRIRRGPRVRGGQLARLGRLSRRRARHRRGSPTTGASASSQAHASEDEATAATGPFAGRYVLGQPGVLGPAREHLCELRRRQRRARDAGAPLGPNATLEGWFRWRSGTTVLRDTTDMGGEGWLLAFATAGKLAYRLGGQGFNTGLADRDRARRRVASHRGDEERRRGRAVRGRRARSTRPPTGAGSQPAVGPWHVMRNGTNAVFSGGEADEVALYTRALGARRDRRPLRPGAAASRRRRCRASRHRPRPSRRSRAPDPAAACWDRRARFPPRCRGPAWCFVRRGTLIARGAPGRRNDLVGPQARRQLARARPAGAPARGQRLQADAAPAW